MALQPLGRKTPPDWGHVEKYPLKALAEASPQCQPVPLGCNWYTSFDTPIEKPDGFHLPDVSKGEQLGTVRGGHCVCLAPMGSLSRVEVKQYWSFYNQGQEGACEGFAHSKALSISRLMAGDGSATFDGFWLYDMARKAEGTYPEGEGTTNRSVCGVLRELGTRTQLTATATHDQSHDGPVSTSLGISTYRWATTAAEVCNVLGRPEAPSVPLLNSWGTNYPIVVWLPVPTLARLLAEEGEASVFTDR